MFCRAALFQVRSPPRVAPNGINWLYSAQGRHNGCTKATLGAAPAFDIARFAGIFAAMGLAGGAIGTMLAALVSGLFALSLWQIPMVLIGVLVLISGPSVIMLGAVMVMVMVMGAVLWYRGAFAGLVG